MNEFYDIAKEGQDPKGPYQLKNLGKKKLSAISIISIYDADGRQTYNDGPHYILVKPSDYDNLFKAKIRKFKPMYDLELLLDHHLHYYEETGKVREKYLKHIKYVILPALKRIKNTDAKVELINDWFRKHTSQKSPTPTVSKLKIGDVNAPTQILVNSPNASQNQEIQYSKEEVEDFLNRILQDAENLKHDLKEELLSEVKTAQAQLKRGKPMQSKLVGILELAKEMGMGVFTNLTASPIYEALKPSLGL